MKGKKPDPLRALTRTGNRPLSTQMIAASDDMGPVPQELTGIGRELWTDVVDCLRVNGRANRVYRHPLRMLCRAYESTNGRDAGVKTLETVRRWMDSLMITPASARGGSGEANKVKETGKARLLTLVANKSTRNRARQ